MLYLTEKLNFCLLFLCGNSTNCLVYFAYFTCYLIFDICRLDRPILTYLFRLGFRDSCFAKENSARLKIMELEDLLKNVESIYGAVYMDEIKKLRKRIVEMDREMALV